MVSGKLRHEQRTAHPYIKVAIKHSLCRLGSFSPYERGLGYINLSGRPTYTIPYGLRVYKPYYKTVSNKRVYKLIEKYIRG